MRPHGWNQTLSLLVFFGVLFILFSVLLPGSSRSAPSPSPSPSPLAAEPLSGFAWSSNLGWISFANNGLEGPGYGVTLLPPDLSGPYRYLSGYAWNSNIGWLKFAPDISALLASGESAPPGNDQWGARLTTLSDGDNFSGWARSCIVFASDCGNSGDLKSDEERGGWDGWLKFSGASFGPGSYNVLVDSGANPSRFIGGGSSYAWGGNVLGWISLCDSIIIEESEIPSYCVYIGSLNAACEVLGENPSTNTVTVSNGESVTWRGTVSGGQSPYVSNWTAPAVGGPGSGNLDAQSGPYVCETVPVSTSESSTFSVTDLTLASASCLADTIVVCNPAGPPPPGGGGDLSPPQFGTIRITSQPLTSPSISSTNTFFSEDGANTTAQVVEAKSLVDSNVSLFSSPYSNFVSCHLSANPVSSDPSFVGCSSASVLLVANHGNDAHFNVKVSPTSAPNLLSLNQYSPYKIIISASSTCPINPLPGDPCEDAMLSFLFDYAVGTVKPI